MVRTPRSMITLGRDSDPNLARFAPTSTITSSTEREHVHRELYFDDGLGCSTKAAITASWAVCCSDYLSFLHFPQNPAIIFA